MPLRYESPEFNEELKKRLNANGEYREKAKGMNWKTLVTVKDVPFSTYSSYSDGELVERKHVAPNELEECKKKADFKIEIPTYDLSTEIASGRKSIEKLFLSGAVKLEGAIFKALQYRAAAELIAKTTADLTNESSIPSKEEFTKMLRKQGLL
jgi:hypothetical protein